MPYPELRREYATMAGAGPPVRPFYRFAATGLGAAMWFWVCRKVYSFRFFSCLADRVIKRRSSTAQRKTVGCPYLRRSNEHPWKLTPTYLLCRACYARLEAPMGSLDTKNGGNKMVGTGLPWGACHCTYCCIIRHTRGQQGVVYSSFKIPRVSYGRPEDFSDMTARSISPRELGGLIVEGVFLSGYASKAFGRHGLYTVGCSPVLFCSPFPRYAYCDQWVYAAYLSSRHHQPTYRLAG